MPEIDSLVEKKASQVDATGTIITAIRLLNRGGAVRWALRALTREVELNGGERKPLMEWVLARYAGGRSSAQSWPT